jgi:Leucine-rich repeat (LRR) protein
MLSHPLPPAENTQVSVQALLIYPALERMNSNDLSVMSSKELRVLNAKVLEFRNLTDVTSLHIERCPNLVFLSSEGLRQLLNLRKMAIVSCGNRVSSCIVPNADSESWKGTDHPAFPRLTHLRIESCGGIAGRWLTEMLPHMQSLEELDIEDCPQMKSISIHHPRQEAESGNLACQAVLPTSLAQDEFLLHIPLNVLSTLEKFHIQRCPEMQLCSSSREGFRGFTSLTELIITGCPMLISSANERFSVPPSVSYLCIEFLPKRLQPYFPENRSSLGFLSVRESPDLQSLRLHCCTALQELQIQSCRQVALEGMQYLSSLRVLSIEMNPELSASWVRRCQDVQQGSGHTRLLPPLLEKLYIRHLQDGLAPYLLAHGTFLFTLVVEDSPNLTSLQLGSLAALRNLQIQDCGSLTTLQGTLPKLEVCFCDSQNLSSLQLGALTALEDLTVYSCDWLTSLETLASFGNLADLAIYECCSVAPLLELLSRQPEGFSIFPRLERLYVDDLFALATPFFKHLTSLRHLRVTYDSNRNSVRFTDEQEKALQLLTSLQGLAILGFLDLEEFPAVLHSLHSLKRLDVRGCPRISRLPEKGLPPSLEVLEINDCSVELQEQCRMLATGKLRVQIYNYHR